MPPQAGLQRMVVLAPNWLGDAVMALPAIDDIRRHYKGARLGVAVRASIAPLFKAVEGVDDVLPLDGRGRLSNIAGLRGDSRRLKASRHELAILLPNSFAAAWLAWRAGVPERWGYRSDWRGPLLTRHVPRPSGERHQVAYYQELVRALGIPNGPVRASVRVSAEDVQRARDLLRGSGIDASDPVVAVAPGAAFGHAKQWPPDRFGDVIDRISRETAARVVLVGSRGDAGSGYAVLASIRSQASRKRVIDLIGRTDLGLLMGVLSDCQALISNDSGAMHLATALGVRVTAIFGSTNERTTGPVDWPGKTGGHKVLTSAVWCRPCMLRECPIDHRCMTGVSPADVFGEARAQLSAATPAASG